MAQSMSAGGHGGLGRKESAIIGIGLRFPAMVTGARITCPVCGFQKVEEMPVNACQHFYRCEGCGALLRPLDGDCCVFCSFADVNCPPKQAA